jgi:hypothetical protein
LELVGARSHAEHATLARAVADNLVISADTLARDREWPRLAGGTGLGSTKDCPHSLEAHPAEATLQPVSQ